MSEYIDLEQTITDAVNDSITPDTDVDTSTPDVDTATPDYSASEETPAEPVSDSTSSEVSSPANATDSQQQVDEFARMAGIPQNGVAGRENRIPYSRVKKITEKAVSEVAEAALGRKLNMGEKAIDVVKAHVAQLPQLQTQVQDYESRLNAVGQFEQVMFNEPQQFLEKLATIPAYKNFFDFVERAYNQFNGQPPAEGQPAQPVTPVSDDMPQPNEDLPDGTKVYNMEGLQSLLAWQEKKVESRMAKQFDDRAKAIEARYAPLENDWKTRQQIEATLPLVRAQIAEAKTWPMFAENESEIVALLEKDSKISLEAAYRKVVFPKILADRSAIRKDVINDIRSAPGGNTTVNPRAAIKPAPNTGNGPRALEDIIKEQVATLHN